VNIDANKVAPWLAIIAIVVGWIVMGTSLFNRVEDHELRIGKIEKKTEARDEALAKTLEELKGSAQYQSWRMDMVIKQLDKKEAKR
jgi:hypothetical protein